MTVGEWRSGEWTPGLGPADAGTLMRIVADSLVWSVAGNEEAFAWDPYEIGRALEQRLATFVTLTRDGELRGCIGSLCPEDALFRSVHTNAVGAATRDHRFSRVRASEVPDLEWDISILGPMRTIAEAAGFLPGAHGIVASWGDRRAVFLPQVATEQGWTREQTLAALARKAGLSEDAWRRATRLEVFEAVVLSEASESAGQRGGP